MRPTDAQVSRAGEPGGQERVTSRPERIALYYNYDNIMAMF